MGIWVLPCSGLEATGAGDGIGAAFGNALSRDAAWGSNIGLACREAASANTYTLSTDGIYSGSAIGSYTVHCICAVYQVRFFFRIRSLPSAEEVIASFASSANALCGHISVSTTGLMRAYSDDSSDYNQRLDFAGFFGTSPTISVGTWYEVRLFTDWGEPAGGLGIPAAVVSAGWFGVRTAIDGTTNFAGAGNYAGYDTGFDAAMSSSWPAGGFGVQGAYLTSVTLMPVITTQPGTPGQYDFDGLNILQYEGVPSVPNELQNSGYCYPIVIPTLSNNPSLFAIPATSVISAGSWTVVGGGTIDYRFLNDPAPSGVTTGAITSSTANDPITVRYTPDGTVYNGTYAGLRISIYCTSHASGNAASVSVDGGTPISIALTSSFWTTVWVREQSVAVSYHDITLTHPNDASALTIQNMIVQRLTYATPVTASGSITVATGTYTGNGTIKSINCGFQPDWIFVSRDDAGAKGVLWWETMLFPQDWVNSTVRSAELVPTTTGFDVVGSAAITNQNTKVYRWFAILDGTKRSLFRGAAATPSSIITTLGSPLTDYNSPPATFTTAALWAHAEALTSAGSANGGYYRGSGHSGTNSSPLSSTQSAVGIRSLPGATWSVGTSLAQNQPQLSFTAWNTAAFTSQPLWAVTSYTGDGSSPRVIPITLGGYKPGWVMVVPHNAISWVRTKSHAAGNSQDMSGSSAANAITAFGGNSITVGAGINTNAVVYDVLAIIDPGSDSGGGGGIDPPDTPISVSDPAPGPPPDPSLILGCIDTFLVGSSTGGLGCTDTFAPGTSSGGGGCVI